MSNLQESSSDSKRSELPPTTSSEHSIQHFIPTANSDSSQLEAQNDNQDDYNELGESISRQSTVLQRFQSRYSFFSKK